MFPANSDGLPRLGERKVNLTPIVRRGHTATPIQLDYNGLPAFLIDASVFPGSSGSPVFIHHEGGYRANGAYQIGRSRLLFVGAVAAVHTQADSGQLVVGAAPAVIFNQLLDLGIVFNWRAVVETVKALFAARGLEYGAPIPPADPSDVEITRADQPPARP